VISLTTSSAAYGSKNVSMLVEASLGRHVYLAATALTLERTTQIVDHDIGSS
jgi:hypothetical protein